MTQSLASASGKTTLSGAAEAETPESETHQGAASSDSAIDGFRAAAVGELWRFLVANAKDGPPSPAALKPKLDALPPLWRDLSGEVEIGGSGDQLSRRRRSHQIGFARHQNDWPCRPILRGDRARLRRSRNGGRGCAGLVENAVAGLAGAARRGGRRRPRPRSGHRARRSADVGKGHARRRGQGADHADADVRPSATGRQRDEGRHAAGRGDAGRRSELGRTRAAGPRKNHRR